MLTKSLAATAAMLALGTGAYSTQAAAQCDPVPGMVIGGGIGAAIGNAPGAAVGAIIGSAITGGGPCYYGRPYGGAYYAPPPRYYAPAPEAYYPAPPPVAYYEPAPVYYGPAYYGPTVVYRSYPHRAYYRGGYRHYAQVRHYRRW